MSGPMLVSGPMPLVGLVVVKDHNPSREERRQSPAVLVACHGRVEKRRRDKARVEWHLERACWVAMRGTCKMVGRQQ